MWAEADEGVHLSDIMLDDGYIGIGFIVFTKL